MGKKGNKSQPSTPSKGSGKSAKPTSPKAKPLQPQPEPVNNNRATDLEEEIIVALLIGLIFSAVFVGADNVLHSSRNVHLDVSQILTRGAICWAPMAVTVFITNRYINKLIFRAFMFVAATGIGQQSIELAAKGAISDQLRYGPYGMIFWAWFVFKMPLPDALLSIVSIGSLAHTKGHFHVPPHVQAKLTFIRAELEQRTGYKLPF